MSGEALISDKMLRPFLAPSFDPAEFLNATLPAWTPSRPSNPDSVTLSELSALTSTLLAQLNAQLTRLSTSLTQLTDEILRSGGRLAYEVEILRSDTTALHELLTARLADDIRLLSLPACDNQSSDAQTTARPEYVTRLRSLAVVRDRLESVIRVFGEATAWVVAPSEVSFSSPITTSTPDQATVANLERTGKEYAERTRLEVLDLLGEGGTSDIEAAKKKIEALRKLAAVWKGTAEERVRLKYVDGLSRLVDDKVQKGGMQGYAVNSDMSYSTSVDR